MQNLFFAFQDEAIKLRPHKEIRYWTK